MKFKYIYQQICSHISIIIVAFIVLSLLFSHYVETLVYTNKAEELTEYGENIIQDLEMRIIDREVLSDYSHVLSGREIKYMIFNEHRRIVYPTGGRIILKDEELNKIKAGQIVTVKQERNRFDQTVTFVLLPYIKNGTFLGGILLTSPISGSREMISQINQYLWYAGMIAMVVALLMSWLLSKIHVNRIKRLQKATSLVAAGDYTVRLPSSNFDEIGELGEDFNEMVEKLHQSNEEIESLENRRRQFMADVSHELRTPLTTINGVIQGMKNNMIHEGEKEKGMQLVSKETNRLIRLVNENLDYEKIRSNQVKLMKTDIELVEVLEIIKDQLEVLADEKNTAILVEVEENVIVYGDYDRLVQILINITKNSIQFTENGTITLRGIAGYKETIIEIEDTGIGIKPEEIQNIWRRFYKADISRTSNPYGEFGLGLSIVKKLVQLHDGEINVLSKKEKGTKFVIRFPIKHRQD
ncbi:HAMP domain-containing sensor histidine kinase [Bacillus sp. B15-48]|uniref:sensor histidine kinase n=1 Tax=Bacillus sp. B15-48 TaxID=1548601 RepID=UPI00193ED41B|nr:HAMP domain-containing sensor histidine kinase [Bacillus sp. B15-48]MBM4761120.1 HAMP domain-containing protein [Bacillus sp. B15-48]